VGVAANRIASDGVGVICEEAAMKKQKDPLLIYVAPALRDEVLLAAEQEGRSISDTVRRILISWAVSRVTERAREERPHAA
jgi:hypothetical protein